MIRFEEVKIGYHETLLTIEDLSLDKGRVYALIGANGSGKSTLMKTILGSIPLLDGRIKMAGRDLVRLTFADKSKHISFVDAHFRGIDHLSVYEYVSLGRAPYTNFMGKLNRSDHEIITRSIERVGLAHKTHSITTQLSDGERQLCAVARAISQSPDFLLLDEPTAFLDYGNRKSLLDMLNQLAKEDQLIVFMSSHDIELCINAELELLVLEHATKKLIHFAPSTAIEEIIFRAFSF